MNDLKISVQGLIGKDLRFPGIRFSGVLYAIVALIHECPEAMLIRSVMNKVATHLHTHNVQADTRLRGKIHIGWLKVASPIFGARHPQGQLTSDQRGSFAHTDIDLLRPTVRLT